MNQEKVTRLNPQILAHETVSLTARITSLAGDKFEIDTGAERFCATRAFGCLLMPEVGDKVAYLKDEQGIRYIVNVLERETDTITIQIPGNLKFLAENGQLDFFAKEGVEIISEKTCSFNASKFKVLATEGEMNIQKLKANGDILDSTINEIHIIASSVTTVAELLMQKAKNSFRVIEVLDNIEAGQVLHSVKKLFSLRSKQTILTSEQDVKIDGARVHIG
jgi:hypothetical protein